MWCCVRSSAVVIYTLLYNTTNIYFTSTPTNLCQPLHLEKLKTILREIVRTPYSVRSTIIPIQKRNVVSQILKSYNLASHIYPTPPKLLPIGSPRGSLLQPLTRLYHLKSSTLEDRPLPSEAKWMLILQSFYLTKLDTEPKSRKKEEKQNSKDTGSRIKSTSAKIYT
jgi:hypothetical protein